MGLRIGVAARRACGWVLACIPLVFVLAAPWGLGARPAEAAPLVAHDYPGGGMIGFGSVDLAAPEMPEPLNSPVLTGVATPDGGGYWLASADGGVFAFGDAAFEGSLGDLPLQGPIVAMAATPDGRGYWLGALDGGVFSFGDAQFYGSMGGTPLNQPIVGMAATPDGQGYWLVAADGGIFTFGDAPFHGSWADDDLPDPVVGMIASPDGGGYTVATADGVVLSLGDAQSFGGLTLDPDATPVSAIIGNGAGSGYWLLDPEAWRYSFALPSPEREFPGSSAIVAAVASQIEPDSDTGAWCNPYGPCEEWCALFATWAWRQTGIAIPSYAFVGDIYYWAADRGALVAPTATPDPGDAVLYGTGPQNVDTSVHVGIVTQVWPDGAIDTVDGDSGPGRDGWLSVTINGPYLPVDSLSYNGVGIYAFAQP
ncbi:MAG: CHAP domain-containing protein [Acidimicrobiales bacterium]